MKAPVARWGPPAAWAAAIFTLSSFSRLPHLPSLLGWDKLQHAGAYAAGGVAFARALRPAGRGWALRAIAAVSFYGVTDELHQHFVPGRSTDVRDWIADTIGAAIGVLVFHQYTVWRARRETSAPAAGAEATGP